MGLNLVGYCDLEKNNKMLREEGNRLALVGKKLLELEFYCLNGYIICSF